MGKIEEEVCQLYHTHKESYFLYEKDIVIV